MKCVILCGGLGTRLREETEFRPKPMVPVGGRPILWHIMKGYAKHGITDFILALGHKGEIIKDYFIRYEFHNNDIFLKLGEEDNCKIFGTHDETGWGVMMAETGENTLKGGRLKRIENYIEDDTFLMTYGDGVSDVDIGALIDFHKSHGKMVTVTGVRPSSRFGELNLKGNEVVSFTEKPEDGNDYINGGFFVFNRQIFDRLNASEDCDLEFGPLEKLALEGEFVAYKHDGFWSCMDTLRDVEYLNRLWKNDKAPWKTW